LNLYDQFQQGVLDRLNEHAFFSNAPAITILGEDMPDTRQQAADLRTTRGILGIMSRPDFNRAEGDVLIFRCSLVWIENQKQNMEGAGGARRAAADCVLACCGLLHRYVVPIVNDDDEPVNPFSQIRIKTADYVGEEDGINVWEIEFETGVSVDAITS
jgi:hypothetical protein